MASTKMSLAVSEPGLPGRSEVDAELIDSVAAKVRGAYREGGLATLLAVGQIVLDEMFGGAVDSFKTSVKSHQSFRALSKRSDLGISASNLWYAVALHENVKVLGEEDAHKLASSAHRLLAHVPDTSERRKLAEKAIEKGLTIKELGALIKAKQVKDPAKPKRGRPPLAAAVKQLNDIERTASRLTKVKPDSVGDVEIAEAKAMLKSARKLREAVTAWLSEMEVELEKRATAGS